MKIDDEKYEYEKAMLTKATPRLLALCKRTAAKPRIHGRWTHRLIATSRLWGRELLVAKALRNSECPRNEQQTTSIKLCLRLQF